MTTTRHLDGTMASLTLTDDTDTQSFPAVYVVVNENPVALTIADPLIPNRYAYPPGIAASSMLTHQFIFDGLDPILVEGARGGGYVQRNSDLVPALVYQTPLIQCAEVLAPCIVQDGGYDFTAMGSTLSSALSTLFKTLLNGPANTNRRITLACRYGYTVAKEQALVVYMPVLLTPDYSFILSSDWQSQAGSFVADLVIAIESWQRANRPVDDPDGGYAFDVSIFSSLQPDSTQPLLQIDNLLYKLS
jgi:hypothetical protein